MDKRRAPAIDQFSLANESNDLDPTDEYEPIVLLNDVSPLSAAAAAEPFTELVAPAPQCADGIAYHHGSGGTGRG